MISAMNLALAISMAPNPVDVLREFDRLNGTWQNSIGVQLVVKDDTARVLIDGKTEFDGKIDLDPAAGTLTLLEDGEPCFVADYRIDGDKLTLTIEGKDVQFKRRK